MLDKTRGPCCLACGARLEVFSPDCPACGAAGSVEAPPPPARAVCAADLGVSDVERVSSGSADLDRALSGGFALGCTVLVWGRAGSGKSRLTAQWASALRPALVLTLEQPREHYVPTARSAGADLTALHLLETEAWQEEAARLHVRAIVVDSISACRAPVRALLALRAWSTATGGISLCVSHINRRGLPRGPSELEHWPDLNLRVSRGPRGRAKVEIIKSRFGPCLRCVLPVVAT